MQGLLAETITLQPGNGLAADLQGVRISQVISAAIVLILIIAAVVFFFILLIGGLRWITSGGDKAQTEAARGQITAALVGLVIVFAAWAIVSIIEGFFGVSLLSFNIPSIQNF